LKNAIESDVIICRNFAALFAKQFGFSQQQSIQIALSASELGNNIVKYASPGLICLAVLSGHPVIFEIVAEDKGSGIADIEQALLDSSTDKGPIFLPKGPTRPLKTGLGCGLGAVKRLMDSIIIESSPHKGTRIKAFKTRQS
jgi:serine/threonine-protein kinase RsbT